MQETIIMIHTNRSHSRVRNPSRNGLSHLLARRWGQKQSWQPCSRNQRSFHFWLCLQTGSKASPCFWTIDWHQSFSVCPCFPLCISKLFLSRALRQVHLPPTHCGKEKTLLQNWTIQPGYGMLVPTNAPPVFAVLWKIALWAAYRIYQVHDCRCNCNSSEILKQ